MTARKYEFLTDGSEALIAQFVKEPSEEAALKVFNEVSRHNTLSSNELKNIAIDEIRKEIQTLATKDELKLSHDSIHDRLSSIENKFASVENRFLSMEDRFLSVENRLSSMEDKFENRFLSMEDRFSSMEDKFENRFLSMEDKFENRFLSMEDRFSSMENKFENRFLSMENRFESRFLSMEEQIKTLATKDELKAEIKASSANVIKWVVSVQIATIASIVVILKLFLNY